MGDILLHENTIVLDIEANNCEEALDALSKRLFETGYVKESYIEAVKIREREYSTGLPAEGIDIAIPHTNIEHVNTACVAVGILKKPVKFKMMGTDDTYVNTEIMFMLALKEHHAQLGMLQNLMALIQNSELLKAVRQSKSPSAVLDLLKDIIK